MNQFAVLFVLDIKKFKLINDSFGYQEGNHALRSIAQSLLGIFPGALMARTGNDNFAVLLEDSTGFDIRKTAWAISEKIRTICSSEGDCFQMMPSIGVYFIPPSVNDVFFCMDRALIARSAVKDHPSKTYAVYDEKFRKKLLNEREIEHDMAAALEQNQFEVYLQPKFDIIQGKVSGSEALIRWNHPEKGQIVPDQFIPVLEKNGFIVQTDLFVFEQICKRIPEWKEQNLPVFPVSFNLSRVHLNQFHFLKLYNDIREKYGVDPALLEFELTESIFMEESAAVFKAIESIKASGYSLSMDDFGSGYSSLALLKELPIDVLKLDRKFFNETTGSDKGRIIVANIIFMAKALDIVVVSEGVETIGQVEFLRGIGCRLAQGYYFAKPMPIPQFEEFVRLSS